MNLSRLLRLDRIAENGSGPLYIRLRKTLRELIADRILAAGEALPTERELADMAGLSRVTVRKAIEDLVSSGHLVRRQGSGTFVAPSIAKVVQPLSMLTSFTEDMARRGIESRSKWLRREVAIPSPEETMALGLSHHAQVIRIERLRLGKDTPLAIERAAISARFLDDPEKIGESLYDALDARGYRPVRATQRLRAMNAGKSEAHLLEIEPGSAVLNIERIAYLESGEVVEFTRSVYRGDSYDFVAELQMPNQKAS